MSQLLTTNELRTHIQSFRNILAHFDYSSLNNIRFFNLEALYAYMDTIPNNPFSLQYDCLQKELDYLQPYLPFVSSERASEFLTAITQTKTDVEVKNLKLSYTQKLRQDFITLARTLTSDLQWESVISTCEEIRTHKEEMCLALQ